MRFQGTCEFHEQVSMSSSRRAQMSFMSQVSMSSTSLAPTSLPQLTTLGPREGDPCAQMMGKEKLELRPWYVEEHRPTRMEV